MAACRLASCETDDRARFVGVLDNGRVWFGSSWERTPDLHSVDARRIAAVGGVDAMEAGLRRFRAG